MIKQHYLVYNYKRSVKIATGRTVGTTTYLSEYKGNKVTSFHVSESSKYFTQVPLERMKLLNGKIWCDCTDDIGECIRQVENYICELNKKDEEKNNLLILKVADGINIRKDRLIVEYRNILEQRRNGLIILPNYFNVEYVGDDTEIIFEEELKDGGSCI